MKRTLPAILAALAALISGPALAQDTAVSENEARAIHDRLLTIDTHIDIGGNYATRKLDPGRFTGAQVDLPSMRIGGLDAGFFIIYTGQGALDPAGFEKARNAAEVKFRGIERLLQGYPDQVGLARTADDVITLAATGRRVVLIGMENAYPLGQSVEDVAMWAGRGVRYVSITHFGNNQFGGSSNPNVRRGDPKEDAGLTELGRELVTTLNDNGIMIDLSHVGKQTGLQAIELSRAPVIASHSGARSVFDNPRNLDDEQLRAIRDSNGVAQMVAFRSYVARLDPALVKVQKALRERLGLTSGAAFGAASPELIEEYRSETRNNRSQFTDVNISQFIDHVDHAVKIAGIDHVGLSGDFDGGGGVKGWDNASQTFNVTRELLRRGYTESDLAKLWSGNILRVMRAVESAAAR